MDRRSLPLNALRAFESVGRHRSFSLAASELGVTHGAVSRQIGMLESMMGLRLFRRSQPIELTDEGETLFSGVAPAFDRLSTAVDNLMCPGADITGQRTAHFHYEMADSPALCFSAPAQQGRGPADCQHDQNRVN